MTYPAKLLLFGEYVLLYGASALSVPLPVFGGRWDFAPPGGKTAKLQELLAAFAYSEAVQSLKGLERIPLEKDLKSGLYFSSNIPRGYGLGSSGALCAAIYDKYVSEKSEDLGELKHLLAGMESYFHGNSSGIDPLTSYTGKNLLVQNKTRVSAVDANPSPPFTFLIDSGHARKTAPLVLWFNTEKEKPAFASMMEREYLPFHEMMVSAWLQGNEEAFFIALEKISGLQWQFFTPMISRELQTLWKTGLDRGEYFLKLCGAGGGGYFLGFSRKLLLPRQIHDQFSIVLPFHSTT